MANSQQETQNWGTRTQPPAPVDVNQSPAYLNDTTFYRIIGIAMGLIAIGSAACFAIFSWHSKQIPEALIAIGSSAIGALASLLSANKR